MSSRELLRLGWLLALAIACGMIFCALAFEGYLWLAWTCTHGGCPVP